MAENDSGLKDEDGEFSDWIEIFNPDATPVSLAGYYLTDNPQNLTKWKFPAVTVNGYSFLVVFASGKDRINPAGKLHTSFQLNSAGDYLALVAPDKTTILTEFSPAYPPQFDNVSYGVGGNTSPIVWSFFSTPTPGGINPAGARAGPVITVIDKNPPQPTGDPLTVIAQVRPVNDAIAGVNLIYRRMFNAETNIVMHDDGSNGDTNANDGIWTAVIPAGAFGPGEMTRWRLTATDASATQTKEPVFRTALDYPQYFGAVTFDSRIQTLLPVFHWFTTNLNGSGSDTGARGSVYYEGEFYDNVFFSVHGQSTAGFTKKSYNIDFNPHNHFRYKTNEARVSDIDLLTNWADKSKVRQVLAYEIMRGSGVAAHFGFTVRVQYNGNFFSTADFIERGNEEYLDRAGLNKDGALYKVYGNTLNKTAGDTGTSGVEKKTRTFESNADLQALINGLALTGTNLFNYIWDNIDVPRCVDMLAANSVIRNIDMHVKNWYIYRDTGRSGEWAILPWDLDLSQGRIWDTTYTYFDNGMFTDGYIVTGDAVRLVALMFQNASMRPMIMRRIRTLSDKFLEPPPASGTPENNLYYERRLNEQSALIDPPSIVPSDAMRDFQKWGSWLQGGQTVSYTNINPAVESMAEAITRFKVEYLPKRRAYIYNTQIVGKGGEIPLPQDSSLIYVYTPLVQAGAAAKAIVPVTNNLALNWIGLASQEPYDTTSWLSGTTGVGYERGTGYESLIGLNVDNAMKSNNSVYIRIEFDVANPAAFDKLELRMKFDDGFVAFLNGTILASSNSPASPVWNSAATVNREANPAAFDIFDVTSKRSSLHAGHNVLAIQGLNYSTNSDDMLVVPELYGAVLTASPPIEPKINFGAYEVSPISGNQDQEYIQLINTNTIAVDMSDWHIIGGIEHDFIPGTVIPAKGSLYLTPKSEAFRARTVSPKGGQGLFIQGGYRNHLSNLGETIMLIDSTGATNATLTYTGQPSDAQNYLVVSEVMYHPPGDGLAEYIEVMNVSPVVTLDMTGIHFSQGIEFNFTGSPIKTLAPGARALVVRDLAAFQAIYGTNTLPVAGVFTNNTALDNNGEHIKLEDADNQTILEFTYSDSAPWPTLPDGTGYSLTLIAPETKPNPALPTSWRASAFLRGSPGATDAIVLPVDPAADADANGQPDLLDYALGNNLGSGPIQPQVTMNPSQSGGSVLIFTYPLSVGADQAKVDVLYSTDLATWQPATAILQAGAPKQLGDGRVLISWMLQSGVTSETQIYLRLRVTPR